MPFVTVESMPVQSEQDILSIMCYSSFDKFLGSDMFGIEHGSWHLESTHKMKAM